ncbi:MAG: metal ABC transporter permease [Spirochaetales bacterium]
METLVTLLSSHTFRIVSFGTATIGSVAGVLGCFAYLQHRSLTGSVVAHSTLSGIMLAFLLSYALTGRGSTDIAVLLPGALATGVASMLVAQAIVRKSLVRIDTAMAVSMSLFFGAGFFLLRIINVNAVPGRSGLDEFLFGQAALITWRDLSAILILAAIAMGITVLLWKEFTGVVFDSTFLAGLGFQTRFLENILLLTMVLAIVLGLKTVGVVLIVALLIAPAAAARQWTKRVSTMAILSAAFGAASGIGGSTLSAVYSGLPTGPIIVILATILAFVSVLAAPKRGLIARLVHKRRSRAKFRSFGRLGHPRVGGGDTA